MHRLAAVLMFCMLAAAVVRAQETLVSYNVTLGAAVAVEDPQAIAVEVTAEYGGTLVEPLRGRTFAMRLSDSRARVLARDPRVESMTVQAPGVPRVAEAMSWGTGVDYTYDGAGNVRKIGTDAFVYDAVSRLVQSDTNGVRRNYEYDGFGNRKKCTQSKDTPTEGDCQQAFTINSASNRVQGVSYDAAGNITVLGGHTYTYDALNVQTRDAWGVLAREYIYTASDERLAVYSVASGSWQWTVRDASGKVLREFTSQDGANGKGTANWTWSKDYIWRDGLLLASRQMEGATAKTYHNHLDHLGTPRRITDSADRIVGIHDYFPFGTEASGGLNEPVLSLLKFTGHERDIVTSQSWDTLDYMHARFANPELGRFLSVDPKNRRVPLKQPQLYNRYAYAMNNPLNFVDLDGEDVTPVRLLMTGGKPKIAYIDSRMVPRLQNLVTTAHKQGVSFTFSSLLRTQDQQDNIKTGNTKNNKGTSPHTAGLAIDINVKSSLQGTDLAGLTTIARGADLSPLNNQAADPPHFQANDLITRGDDGKVDDQFKALVEENQQQVQDYEKKRKENPEEFEKDVVDITPPRP